MLFQSFNASCKPTLPLHLKNQIRFGNDLFYTILNAQIKPGAAQVFNNIDTVILQIRTVFLKFDQKKQLLLAPIENVKLLKCMSKCFQALQLQPIHIQNRVVFHQHFTPETHYYMYQDRKKKTAIIRFYIKTLDLY